MSHRRIFIGISAVVMLFASTAAPARGAATPNESFWSSRDVQIPADPKAPVVRIAIWDSGVDITLFDKQLARDPSGQPIVRGYDGFKRRQDTPLAVLPEAIANRKDELNQILQASDDRDGRVESDRAKALSELLKRQTPAEAAEFDSVVGRWGGYAHGTAVADISLTGHARSEIVIARMEWWHGSPPVPCWTRELADREADSMRDLIAFLIENKVRVVNMSWGRFEKSYLSNLEQCAPDMPLNERQSLARYTVERIRAVLRDGMASAPDVLFVGAAGNAGASVEAANPATRFSLPNFILVGAVDRNGAITDFTNTGPEVTLYANGDRVPARLPGGALSFPSGTSMATPLVTNAAAKMLAMNPRLTGAQLRTLLEQTATANETGQRLLHTKQAVEAASKAGL